MKKQMRFMGTCVKGIFYSLIMLSMGACAGQQSQQGSGVNELAVIQVEGVYDIEQFLSGDDRGKAGCGDSSSDKRFYHEGLRG